MNLKVIAFRSFYLCFTTCLLLYSYERTLNLNNILDANLHQKYFFSEKISAQEKANLITDLILIPDSQQCPQFYQEILPNPSHYQKKQEKQLQSENQTEYLIFKTDDQNSKTKLKICSRLLDDLDFRSIDLEFEVLSQFSKMCVYSDTKKRGYISESNQCSKYSTEQQCEKDHIKLESPFMLYCLNNIDREMVQKQFERLSCSKNEIACSTLQTLFCIKDTQKCPITDLQVSRTELVLESYERIPTKLDGFFLYIQRDALLVQRLVGLKIEEQSNVLENSILQNIQVINGESDSDLNKLKTKVVQKQKWSILEENNIALLKSIKNIAFAFIKMSGVLFLQKVLIFIFYIRHFMKNSDLQIGNILKYQFLTQFNFFYLMWMVHLILGLIFPHLSEYQKYQRAIYDLDKDLYDLFYTFSVYDILFLMECVVKVYMFIRLLLLLSTT